MAVDELRGDVVGGDKIVVNVSGRHGAKVRAYRITAERLGHPYVEASGGARVGNAVARGRMVVVRGPQGSGKSAALLHALTGGSTDVAVLRLDRATDLTALAPAQFVDHQALVLEDLTAEHLGQLTEYEIERLHSELGSLWIGFTMSDDVLVPPALTGVLVDIGDPPSTRAVFDEHFRAAQPANDVREAALSAPGVRKQIDSALARPRLGGAAALARYLATYEPPFDELADRVREYRALGGDEQQLWFRRLPDLRASCTALSLAVFNGSAREDVTGQAGRLVERIAPTPENEKRDEVDNVFGAEAAVPLALLEATVTREVVSYVQGDVTLAVMRYSDPERSAWVLRHVWDEFDAARPSVVAWLRALGGYGDRLIRQRSAVAVGVLAERAFTVVFQQIICIWADDSEVSSWRSAAIALSVPARNDELGPVVDRIMQEWMETGSATQRATAALVLGETVDPTDPAEAIRRLAALADDDVDDGVAVAVGVALSLGDMLTSYGGSMSGQVLHAVVGWMAEARSRSRRWTAHLAFVRLTEGLGDPRRRLREDPFRTVPTLLVAARLDQAFARQLAWAWRTGLNGVLHGPVRRSLTDWAKRVEDNPDVLPVFVWLMREAAADPRAATIVERVARSWTPGVAPGTAAAVLQRLKE